jgi:hypothetical protein
MPQRLWLETVLSFARHFDRAIETPKEKRLAARLYEWYVHICAHCAYYQSEQSLAILADVVLKQDTTYVQHAADVVVEELRTHEQPTREALAQQACAKVVEDYRAERRDQAVAEIRQRRVSQQN